jgi:hypothetical protein
MVQRRFPVPEAFDIFDVFNDAHGALRNLSAEHTLWPLAAWRQMSKAGDAMGLCEWLHGDAVLHAPPAHSLPPGQNQPQ